MKKTTDQETAASRRRACGVAQIAARVATPEFSHCKPQGRGHSGLLVRGSLGSDLMAATEFSDPAVPQDHTPVLQTNC
ncbi:hypothetical protein VZT92_016079 [Zoarces viviparus]|uniref:Uncharacterized protein n=1 Tax=Zoarces viviparus TaxID=48416 RepID=A0AAW1ERZ8_ZOAVI